MSLTILPSMSLLISSVKIEGADCAAIDYSFLIVLFEGIPLPLCALEKAVLFLLCHSLGIPCNYFLFKCILRTS